MLRFCSRSALSSSSARVANSTMTLEKFSCVWPSSQVALRISSLTFCMPVVSSSISVLMAVTCRAEAGLMCSICCVSVPMVLLVLVSSRITKCSRLVLRSLPLTSTRRNSVSSLKPAAPPLRPCWLRWLPTASVASSTLMKSSHSLSSPHAACRTSRWCTTFSLVVPNDLEKTYASMRCCSRGMSMISRKYCSTVPSLVGSLMPLYFGCFPAR
mmetsp:Transcript_27063/g.69540  ORF Transcript_27063/g.69540 Transcript_27063/m.69540 type:complete len:213 (-) Transcript_27063:452-1090(-)